MIREMNSFILAHDRYLALDLARTDCTSPAQREFMHIKILEAISKFSAGPATSQASSMPTATITWTKTKKLKGRARRQRPS